MKKFLENTTTLFFEVILFILFTIWFIFQGGFEPFIGIVGSLAAIVVSIFFKIKKSNENNSTEINNSKNVNTGNINTKGGNVRIGDDN